MALSDGAADRTLAAGALAGLAAGVGMGLVLHLALGLMPVIATLIGRDTVLAGWVVHLFNSMLFGLLFVVVFVRPIFEELLVDLGGCVSLGVVHSAALGLLTGGLLLPVSLALADATSLPIPTLPFPGIDVGMEFAVVIALAHVLYGVLLGTTFAVLTGVAGVGRVRSDEDAIA
ncbi:hypothetical protein [Haloparvum sedimenti]|uniref:hypothetical protein n=1 Tax=Haloparvum sedimenti TaxID=1678448 RepID=UPI00071E6A49|nr:hypothetical protein [Haloparvum sedimenti]